jgi:hypothetical protein
MRAALEHFQEKRAPAGGAAFRTALSAPPFRKPFVTARID